MRTIKVKLYKFKELKLKEQKQLRENEINAFLQLMLHGIEFGEEIDQEIQKCLYAAEKNCTPWFAHEYLWDNTLIQEFIINCVEEQLNIQEYRYENNLPIIFIP